MILFFDKKNGEIFSVIDGRVHDEASLNMYTFNSNIPKEDVGKYIIGWINKNGSKIESNMDKFDILEMFEDITPESPLDYKIDTETGFIIKKVV